nr:MAG TPA: PASTA domain [Caudoviricetes sp.]
MKAKSFLLASLVCISAISLIACKEETITISDVVGMSADEAVNTLNEAGFTNVILSADESSESSMVLDSSNWTVVSQSPEADSEETEDTEINLSCKKTDEIAQEDLNQVINLSVPDAQKKLDDLGYTVSYFHQDSGMEITVDLSVYTEEELTKWIVTDIKSFDIDNKTIELIVNTDENIAANEAASETQATLESKLSAIAAWNAAEDYGKSEYPYGFELHYIMDKLAEEAADENTWFLKATCTVTNAYNAETEATCEAKVTGTSDNPQVVSFMVY